MGKTESEIQQQVMIEGPKHGCILMRNNSGAFKDTTGRWVRYGLGNTSKKQNAEFKSSDLIGITTIQITPDMVGQIIGVFTAIEVKAEGTRLSKNDSRVKAQIAFVEFIKARGGIANVVTSVDEFTVLMKK